MEMRSRLDRDMRKVREHESWRSIGVQKHSHPFKDSQPILCNIVNRQVALDCESAECSSDEYQILHLYIRRLQ